MMSVAAMRKTPHVGLVFSTEVGMRTQYLNWRKTIDEGNPLLKPTWVVIDWWQEKGWIENLPLVPHGIKAALRCRAELARGLAQGPFDALFLAQFSLFIERTHYLTRQPYFLTSDCTARQLQSFGNLYGKYQSRIPGMETRKERNRKFIYSEAAGVFPWSRWAAQSMIEEYGARPERVVIAPPGVDLEKWDTPDRYSDPLRDRDHCHILFVGGDFYRKGGDLLVEWATRTKKKNWTLHLVTRDRVEVNDPRIHVYNNLTPNDPALIALYRQADIFALPTRGDCYSIAGIEALASRLPVLLGLSGGTGDVIKEGETGYLVHASEPDAATQIAERLECLLQNPALRQRMGEAGRRDAEERYDVHKNIERTVDHVLKLI